MYTYTLFAHAVLRILERHKNCMKADKAYSFLLTVMPLLEKNVTILGLGNLSHTKATALQFINSFVALVVCAIQCLGLTPHRSRLSKHLRKPSNRPRLHRPVYSLSSFQ